MFNTTISNLIAASEARPQHRCTICNDDACDCGDLLESAASAPTELERWNANNRLNNRAFFAGIRYCNIPELSAREAEIAHPALDYQLFGMQAPAGLLLDGEVYLAMIEACDLCSGSIGMGGGHEQSCPRRS